MKRITIKDLADHAGVSTATVDRVLNGRDGVSDKSRRRVKEAIHQLGFRQLPEFVSNQPKPTLRLKWILPHPNTVFSEELKNAVRAAPAVVEKFDIVIDIKHLTPREHNSLINSIEETDPAIFDGVAVFAVDAPGVRLAINRAVERGLKVVTLISDVPTSRRHYYVGIDNTAAGRAAGTLMARFIGPQEGKIGVIAGTLTQRDHVDRLFGFEQIIRARCPRLRILPIEQGDSIRRNNAAITRSLVDRYKDLKGIYSFGAGNAGVLEALNERGVSDEIVVILHELSDDVREALRDGTVDAVLAQDTGHFARSAMRVLVALCSGGKIIEAQERKGVDIYLADNLP